MVRGFARFGRWWDLLPVRVAAAVNLAVLVVLATFWWADARRTRSTLLEGETRKLREEARVLRVAQSHLASPGEFQDFLDRFCEQMDVASSPAHHIGVFSPAGEVIVRARVRADPSLEARMAAHRHAGDSQFSLSHERFLSVSMTGADGTKIVVAQSLAPVQEVIDAQTRSRAYSVGTIALVILAVTLVATVLWVHVPLQRLVRGLRAIGRGELSARVPPTGSAELRHLAEGLNEMASALQRADQARRSQMRRAREIQRRLLPSDDRRVAAYEVAAAFEPAESVGGDFYDVLELADGSLLVAVLDVSGHGVPAALHTALLRTILRYEARAEADPPTIVGAMNREFLSVTDAGEFATCLLMRLSPTGRVEFTSAGHDPGVILRGDGSAVCLDATGPVLGVLADQTYVSGTAELGPDDQLFLFTDGLYEIAQSDGTVLGRERWIVLLGPHSGVDVNRLRAWGAADVFSWPAQSDGLAAAITAARPCPAWRVQPGRVTEVRAGALAETPDPLSAPLDVRRRCRKGARFRDEHGRSWFRYTRRRLRFG